MQKIKILLLIIILPPFVLAEELPECIDPTNLEKLGKTLSDEVSNFSTKPARKHNVDYNNLLVSKKYSEMNFLIDKYFPKDYRQTFDDYMKEFEELDLIYRQAIIEANSEVIDIQPKWEFHYYVLTDIFPVLLNSRFFTPTRVLSPDPDVEKLGKEFWDTLSKAEFSPENLQVCRDEKERQAQKNLKKDLEKLREDVEDKPYKQVLENPTINEYSMDFYSDYENLTTELELQKNKGGKSKFNTDPRAAAIKEEEKKGIWKSIKGFFGATDEIEEPFVDDPQGDNKTNTNNLFKNLEYITTREKTLDIQDRYMQWRNDRNFWMQKTNQVSGYNLDVLVEKFEIMLDAILRTNKELTDSLLAIETICESQNESINCWKNGNVIPRHDLTIPEEYKKRTAEKDN